MATVGRYYWIVFCTLVVACFTGRRPWTLSVQSRAGRKNQDNYSRKEPAALCGPSSERQAIRELLVVVGNGIYRLVEFTGKIPFGARWYKTERNVLLTTSFFSIVVLMQMGDSLLIQVCKTFAFSDKCVTGPLVQHTVCVGWRCSSRVQLTSQPLAPTPAPAR